LDSLRTLIFTEERERIHGALVGSFDAVDE